jgi:putative transposase
LNQLATHPLQAGKPHRLWVGPAFISTRLTEWCEAQGIALHCIQPGNPTQDVYIERINGSFRRELLDAHLSCFAHWPTRSSS